MENQTLVDQQAHPALAILATRPEHFAQQGSISPCWRRRGDKTYGPYYRLRYRDAGCPRSLYLGRAGPLVDRVRQVLHTLQEPLRRRRALNQLHRRVRGALRVDRRQVDARLRPLGLRLKGFEVRGWRTSPLRTLARVAGERNRVIASARIKPFRLPRVRQLRFVLTGRAATWMRQNRPKIPCLPQARLQAFLEAREQNELRSTKRPCGHGHRRRGRGPTRG